MRTAKILAASFLAAALSACGHGDDDGRFFSCRNDDRGATVAADDDTVTLGLQREVLLSYVPYVMGYEEIWSETSPRSEMEYQRSVANSFCQTGTMPQPKPEPQIP